MSKRPKCEHDLSSVQIQGCGVCVAEAMAGLRIVQACRREFGMDAADIVNIIRKEKGLPPLIEDDEGES